jgi:8-oxo-dGTP pyrophosphatase MutT (NUDIX family)
VPSATAASRCELVIVARRPLDPAVERAVDAAWRSIRAGEPQLFDGALLSVRDLRTANGTVRIEAEVVGYRDFVVQRRGLADLGVRPLGVTGITRAGDAVLLGRRTTSVTQYPGRWEPVPAGSVSPSDRPDVLEDQLLAELGEETGIDHDEVEAIAVVGVVDDEADHVIDVCFALTVAEAAARRAVAEHANPAEHAELALRSASAAVALAADASAAVPTMAPMLRLALGDLHTGA